MDKNFRYLLKEKFRILGLLLGLLFVVSFQKEMQLLPKIAP